MLSILDHAIRRDQPTRVIGALLGVRSEDGEVEVRNCFALPHTESEDQVCISLFPVWTIADFMLG
jgi:translation initiation factor 3 subunit F